MLFKTIDDVIKYSRASKGMNFETFAIYEPLAQEKYMRRFCGDELLDLINAWHDEDEPDQSETALVALLPYLQSAIANFTLALAAPSLDLVLLESGFGVVNNPNLAPASKDRVANFIKNQEELAYVAIEKLLRFLEANKADYSSWANSDAYTTKWEFFVPNALVFNKIIPINESRKAYFDLLPHMNTAEEQHIIPVMDVAMAEALKSKQMAGTLAGKYLAAMKLTHKAAAYFTKYMAAPDEKIYYEHGMVWIAALKSYLHAHADALTEYKDGEAYEADGVTPNYTNDDCSSVFVVGGFPVN